MNFIGVDLGTSAVKLLLVNEKGEILNTVSREYPVSFPHPGWSEQNPEDWYDAVISGIRSVIEGTDPHETGALAVAGQMHGLVVLDKDDKVLRPAILWNDGRTEEETQYLNNVIGTEKLRALTGNIAFAGFTAPKILWMKKHEPELFGKIAKIMLPKDYINYRLTGEFVTDCSDASGMLLFDVQKRTWSSEMLEICGIGAEQLPAIHESYETVGTLSAQTAELTGLSETVKVAAGAGDNAGAAIGTGTVGDGKCNISVGTSGTLFISCSEYKPDSTGALHTFAHSDGGYHLMGCMLSAASCNKWWMDDILGTQDYGAEQAQISDEKLGRNHVYFLPYLMGERAPHNDPASRGCFIGMSMDTTRADMTQAVLEGVAFGMRDSLEAAKNDGYEVTSSMICGGGSKSPLWKKIFANVLNLKLTFPETEQGPGYGAAILGMVTMGVFESVEQAAAALVKTSGSIEPDPELAARYDEKYKTYRELYPALKDSFGRL